MRSRYMMGKDKVVVKAIIMMSLMLNFIRIFLLAVNGQGLPHPKRSKPCATDYQTVVNINLIF
jgi:hypothetical protein